MAQKMTVQMVDDLDGSPFEEGEGETITYGLDGATYVIDLNAKNAKKFRDSLVKYLDVSRKAPRESGRATSATAARKADRPYDLDKLRAWASENGIEISARGRIKKSIVDQYLAAS